MKVYRLEVVVIDFDEVGEDIGSIIENARYPNRCIHPKVISSESRDIGEWSDDHPLNQTATCVEEFRRLFAKD